MTQQEIELLEDDCLEIYNDRLPPIVAYKPMKDVLIDFAYYEQDELVCRIPMIMLSTALLTGDCCQNVQAAICYTDGGAKVFECAQELGINMELLLILYMAKGIELGHFDPSDRIALTTIDLVGWRGECLWRQIWKTKLSVLITKSSTLCHSRGNRNP